MPELDVNDTVKIAADGTVVKPSTLRRLAAWWTPHNVSRLFSRLVAASGLIAGLAVVGWFSGEVVAYRWKTIQETDTHGYIEMAKAFSRFQWPRWPDEFSRFRGHVWIDPAPEASPAVAPEESPPAPGAGMSADAAASPETAVPAPMAETASGAGPPAPRPVMAKYSPGWPLLLVVGYWCDDARGMLWVNPILAMLGALAFFLLARELGGNVAAAICTFIWLTAPMTLMYTTYPLGHGPEITFTLLAFFFAMRWGRTGKAYWAFPAAFCTGYLSLIRPTTVLFWPAIALTYLVIRSETRSDARARDSRALPPADSARRNWRDGALWPVTQLRRLNVRRLPRWLLSAEGRPWLAAAIGAGIPLTFLAWYNYHSFGHVLRSGYYYTGEQKAFDLDWIFPGLNAWFGSTWHGGPDLQWIQERWRGVFHERFFVLDERYWLLCLFAIVLRLRRPGMAWVFTLWLLPTLLLYMGYYFFDPSPIFFRFVLTCVPACILSIAFLFAGPVRKSALAQLLLLLLATAWMWHAPPRYFERRSQVARNEQWDRNKFPWGSPAARDILTGNFQQAKGPMRTADLEPWLRAGPVAVYAHSHRQWEVGEYLNVRAYDIDAWLDQNWSRPYQPNSVKMSGVWGDHERGKRIHAEMAKLGSDGIKALFVSQVQAHLDAGRKVYLLVEERHPVLGWARANPGWQVENAYARALAPESQRHGREPLVLWEVRPAPKDAATGLRTPPAAPHADEGQHAEAK